MTTAQLDSRNEHAFRQTMNSIVEALSAFHDTLTAEPLGPVAPAAPHRALLDLLLSPAPTIEEIGELAAEAGWKVPQHVAVVALDHLPKKGVFPPGVLVGRHRPIPCLIVPDPDGPGRRPAIEAMLEGHRAAVGIPVRPTRAAKSFEWASRTLRLSPVHRPVFAADHLPLLFLTQDPELASYGISRALAPLMTVRESLRRDLAETLVACFEQNFNATAVATRLHLHPQTVRYRIRNLESLFGDRLTDPAHHLELHMLLTLWLSAPFGYRIAS
ncbi:hypothetical protein GCM10027589_33300 [Actinocorallia lasiicapitis]